MNLRPMEVEEDLNQALSVLSAMFISPFGKILCVSQWLKEDGLIDWFIYLFSATTVSHDCETQVRPRLHFINLMFLMSLVKALSEQHRRRELGLYPVTWRWEWTARVDAPWCWESESLRPKTWLSGHVSGLASLFAENEIFLGGTLVIYANGHLLCQPHLFSRHA